MVREDREKPYADYDRFAWFYNRYWGPDFSRTALRIFERILFPYLPDGALILDLCCGTGQIAAALLARGYEVTGIDGSEAMLNFARENAPAGRFLHADARDFALPDKFHAVLSPFDSLNHIMERDELLAAFSRVHEALLDEGVFLFDMNLEEEHEALGSSFDIVSDDHACIVRSGYHPSRKLKRYDLTLFRLEGENWRRTDLTLHQRYYETQTVIAALVEAGFPRIKTYDARSEFGPALSDGRMFYLAMK